MFVISSIARFEEYSTTRVVIMCPIRPKLYFPAKCDDNSFDVKTINGAEKVFIEGANN